MDQELKEFLQGMESRMDARFDQKMGKMEARLVEKMRDVQTELLRGFAAFSEGQTIRFALVQQPEKVSYDSFIFPSNDGGLRPNIYCR